MEALQEQAFSVANETDRRTAVSLSHTIATGSDDAKTEVIRTDGPKHSGPESEWPSSQWGKKD